MKTVLKPPLYLVNFIVIMLAVISFLAAITLGAMHISAVDALSAVLGLAPDEITEKVIWQLRMPRTALAFLAGMGLALAGLILQTITRNPLADPYLFGVSSGASFGVVMVMFIFGTSATLIVSVGALLGSVLAIALLLLITGLNRTQQIETMILAGVALSFLFSAATSFLLYHSDPQSVTSIMFWTLGSFARAQWHSLWLPLLSVVLVVISMLAYRKSLLAMLLGDESAVTLGINVAKLRVVMLVLSSLLTATIVAVCGGIGFVGLMIPHLVRFFISTGHSSSVLLTALTGGIFMMWVDVASRSLLPTQELPVGIITAAIGSLFFIVLLRYRRIKHG